MMRMTRFCVLAVPAFGFRADVKDHMDGEKRGFALLEALRRDPENIDYQNEYRALIGDVKWEEPRIFLETGVTSSQEPASLGPMSQSGTALTIAERGADVAEATGLARTAWDDSSSVTSEQLASAASDATMVAGRWLMNRRDYIVQGEGDNLEYIIDGALASMHSRMFVTIAGEEEPRFVLKRAFNYYNPIATNFGQYVYRVVRCVPRNGECSEGDILYTITKDRYGRGFRWKHEEYRVYTGTGGCSQTGNGILSCHQDLEIMYSLVHDDEAIVYKGKIVSIDADRENGRVAEDGRWFPVHVGLDELESMKVANITKVAGPPHQLTSSMTNYLAGGIYGMGLDAARATVWTDGYRLSFEGGGGSVDQLLVTLLVAVQDLTSDIE